MNTRSAICLPRGKEYLFIHATELKYIESEGSYSNFHLLDGQKILVSKNLKSIENLLDESIFIRVHNSIIVNILFVKKIYTVDNFQLELIDGSCVPMSRRRKKVFLDHFTKI